MDYDPEVQDGKDGALTPAVRARINSFRPEFTLADIGQAFDFSGAFVSHLLNSRHPGRVRTLHIPRIMAALEKAEAERVAKQQSAPKLSQSSGKDLEELRAHVRAIETLGFNVTLSLKRK